MSVMVRQLRSMDIEGLRALRNQIDARIAKRTQRARKTTLTRNNCLFCNPGRNLPTARNMLNSPVDQRGPAEIRCSGNIDLRGVPGAGPAVVTDIILGHFPLHQSAGGWCHVPLLDAL